VSDEQEYARKRARTEIDMIGGARCVEARIAHVALLRHYLANCRAEIRCDAECTGCALRPFCAVALPLAAKARGPYRAAMASG